MAPSQEEEQLFDVVIWEQFVQGLPGETVQLVR